MKNISSYLVADCYTSIDVRPLYLFPSLFSNEESARRECVKKAEDDYGSDCYYDDTTQTVVSYDGTVDTTQKWEADGVGIHLIELKYEDAY